MTISFHGLDLLARRLDELRNRLHARPRVAA
jgi:hypothetical protein